MCKYFSLKVLLVRMLPETRLPLASSWVQGQLGEWTPFRD